MFEETLIVATTSSALLGLTVGCARCHNHKFDPIPQTDYYAMKAIFEDESVSELFDDDNQR